MEFLWNGLIITGYLAVHHQFTSSLEWAKEPEQRSKDAVREATNERNFKAEYWCFMIWYHHGSSQTRHLPHFNITLELCFQKATPFYFIPNKNHHFVTAFTSHASANPNCFFVLFCFLVKVSLRLACSLTDSTEVGFLMSKTCTKYC